MLPARTVRFKLAWRCYRVGDTIVPNALLRDWLIARGFCDPVVDTPTEEKASSPPLPRPKKRKTSESLP